MIIDNPQPIRLKDSKSANIKQKIVNHLYNLIFAIVLNRFSNPEQSLSDTQRRINKATEVQPQRLIISISDKVIVVLYWLAFQKWSSVFEKGVVVSVC